MDYKYTNLLSLTSSLFGNNTEKFTDASGVKIYEIVILVVVIIILAILTPIATYRIMGNSVLHAVLAFFFGFIYITLVWLWAGLFTKRKLRV